MQLSTPFEKWLLVQARIDPLQIVLEGIAVAQQSPTIVLFVLTGVALTIGLAVAAFRKTRPAQPLDDDKLLFSELCRGNHLSRRQRQLLLGMAQAQKVASPSQMFIDANLWAADSDQPGPWQNSLSQTELHRLRSLLFTQGKTASLPEACGPA